MNRSLASALLVVVMVVAGCSSAHAPTAAAAQRRDLAARYLAIATVGNRGLEVLDQLTERDHDDLAAARTDLRAAAATERRFDRSLLAITFPPAMEATAHALVRVNESRATLTTAAAAAVSLEQLHRDERQLATANDAVERQVKSLRAQLGLPAPDPS